ncbi:MAG: dephospho-CoA kinase [Gammaproteobacteria bacterium]|nr:dephospho-CoA kinase [Gammaproteobacteria bacterium]
MVAPYKIGLTGGICSGKSMVADFFSELGVKVIDADIISRELTRRDEPLLDEIVKEFGDDILDHSGELKREVLRTKIFNDKNARVRLENLIHPKVFEKIEIILREIDTDYCILCVPLLFETGSEKLVDSILVVDCPEELQLERIIQRDGTTSELAKSIIANQVSREERLKKANEIIINNMTLDILKSQVQELHEEYLKRSLLLTG